jgi:ribosome biogenesis protein Nip4
MMFRKKISTATANLIKAIGSAEKIHEFANTYTLDDRVKFEVSYSSWKLLKEGAKPGWTIMVAAVDGKHNADAVKRALASRMDDIAVLALDRALSETVAPESDQ